MHPTFHFIHEKDWRTAPQAFWVHVSVSEASDIAHPPAPLPVPAPGLCRSASGVWCTPIAVQRAGPVGSLHRRAGAQAATHLAATLVTARAFGRPQRPLAQRLARPAQIAPQARRAGTGAALRPPAGGAHLAAPTASAGSDNPNPTRSTTCLSIPLNPHVQPASPAMAAPTHGLSGGYVPR